MQHVELYTDTCNMLFEMISCSIRQNKYARIFNGTNTVFSNSTGPWPKLQKGGKIHMLRLQHVVSAVRTS